MASTPHAVLQRYWGFAAFREQQHEVIDAALSGRDALVVLATGSGKSVWWVAPGVLNMFACDTACLTFLALPSLQLPSAAPCEPSSCACYLAAHRTHERPGAEGGAMHTRVPHTCLADARDARRVWLHS
jgi:hypothetical protein